jgi:hypothetical protein
VPEFSVEKIAAQELPSAARRLAIVTRIQLRALETRKEGKERKGKARKRKERKGTERKGKEMKRKEKKGTEKKGKEMGGELGE